MLDNLYIFLILFLILGPPIIPSYVAVSALRSGSYLRRTTKSEMVFLAPISPVVFVVTLFVWLVCLCIITNPPRFFSLDWQGILSRPSATASVGALGLFIAGLYWVTIRWYQKRCPLVLNLERRRYRTVDYSIKLSEQTGSWDEIAGIYVDRTSAKGTVIFYVRLRWKGSKKLPAVMGGFSKQEKAEAFAAQMAQEIGLPIVASPF